MTILNDYPESRMDQNPTPCQSAPDAPGPRQASPWARRARLLVQAGFLLLCVLVGLQFRSFVLSLGSDGPVAYRPAGVEAFLPISSLMSLVHTVKTGVVNRIHPAGMILFALTLVLAVAVRRGFCSWVCPFGTLSEYAYKLGQWMFGRNYNLPRWLDWPLMSLKYLLLGFFLYFILPMPAIGLDMFIHGPYNRIADVKMYMMFANITRLTLAVLIVLTILSVLVRNFWCRYLCPYGALLGILSFFSPLAVRRDTARCTDCGRCSRVCPNRIPVSRRRVVRSHECTACLGCVHACKPGALELSAGPRSRRLRLGGVAYALITVGAFLLVAVGGRVAGYWHSQTSPELYRGLYQALQQIDHPRTGYPYAQSSLGPAPQPQASPSPHYRVTTPTGRIGNSTDIRDRAR